MNTLTEEYMQERKVIINISAVLKSRGKINSEIGRPPFHTAMH